jgi:hypothetical protein
MSIYSDMDTKISGTTWDEILSTKTYSSLIDQYNTLQVTNAFYQRLLNLREDFNSIYIYVSQAKQISYTVKGEINALYDPTHESWFQKTVQANGSTVISAPHLPFQFDYNEKVISFSRLLKRLDTNKGDYYGVILIDLCGEGQGTPFSRWKAGCADKGGEVFTDLQYDRYYGLEVIDVDTIQRNSKGPGQAAAFQLAFGYCGAAVHRADRFSVFQADIQADSYA